MCSHAEWEKVRHGVEDAVESEGLRDFLTDAAAHVEALIDEIRARACASERGEWVHRCERRSRPRWVV
jgi:hypothetical protein